MLNLIIVSSSLFHTRISRDVVERIRQQFRQG